MGITHRPFGVDKEALERELARREQAHRSVMDRLRRESERLRTELDQLQAEEAVLIALQRRLHDGESRAPASDSVAIPSWHAELGAQIVALQQVQGELLHLRSLRARLVDQVRESLAPYLQPSPPGTLPVKEAANV